MELPDALADGVTVTVRAPPVPPMTMPELGMSPVLDDAPVTVGVRDEKPVMENGMAAVELSSLMVWLPIADITTAASQVMHIASITAGTSLNREKERNGFIEKDVV